MVIDGQESDFEPSTEALYGAKLRAKFSQPISFPHVGYFSLRENNGRGILFVVAQNSIKFLLTNYNSDEEETDYEKAGIIPVPTYWNGTANVGANVNIEYVDFDQATRETSYFPAFISIPGLNFDEIEYGFSLRATEINGGTILTDESGAMIVATYRQKSDIDFNYGDESPIWYNPAITDWQVSQGWAETPFRQQTLQEYIGEHGLVKWENSVYQWQNLYAYVDNKPVFVIGNSIGFWGNVFSIPDLPSIT